jgi:V8-like Glu-specific endopeptidase
MNNQQDNSVKQQHTDVIIWPEDRDPEPNSAVVRLSFDGNGYGTGFLHNKTTIITALHNIHKTTQLFNREAEILECIPYPNGAPSTKSNGPNPRDLALIKLKPPGIPLNSYIKLAEGTQKAQCLVIGYDMYDNYVKGDEGLATKSDDDLYAYQMDTEGGQSGGPLLLSGTQQAIGVHIFGRSNINNAAAVTAEFISWVNRHSA